MEVVIVTSGTVDRPSSTVDAAASTTAETPASARRPSASTGRPMFGSSDPTPAGTKDRTTSRQASARADETMESPQAAPQKPVVGRSRPDEAEPGVCPD